MALQTLELLFLPDEAKIFRKAIEAVQTRYSFEWKEKKTKNTRIQFFITTENEMAFFQLGNTFGILTEYKFSEA